jgi:hypothetical protein
MFKTFVSLLSGHASYLVTIKCACNIPASHYGTLIITYKQSRDVVIFMYRKIYEM